jgi:hypothetical protein
MMPSPLLQTTFATRFPTTERKRHPASLNDAFRDCHKLDNVCDCFLDFKVNEDFGRGAGDCWFELRESKRERKDSSNCKREWWILICRLASLKSAAILE